MRIEVLSPTRVDLAGGTLDCWPLYLFLKAPVTVNVGISIFTRAVIEKLQPGTGLQLVSEDQNANWTFESIEELDRSQDQRLRLVQEVVRYWDEKGLSSRLSDIKITTKSESPIGGGLGGSSSLTISALKASAQYLGYDFSSDTDLVRVASHIEARILEKPTGTQDYFPALEGGLCRIYYEADGPRLERSLISEDFFAGRFLLVYTGRAHHSGLNNWHVIRSYLDGDPDVRSHLKRLSEISRKVSSAIELNQIELLKDLFHEEYRARIALSKGFSSPEIEDLAESVLEFGAVVKICGAGGGGSVMVWCPERNRDAVSSRVRDKGYLVLDAEPWVRT